MGLTSFSLMASAAIGRSADKSEGYDGRAEHVEILAQRIAVEIERLLVEARLIAGEIVIAAFAPRARLEHLGVEHRLARAQKRRVG